MEEARKLNGKRILLYLGITFVLTYAMEILVIAPMLGSADPNQAMMAQSLVASVMFFPALGVVLTRLFTKEGFMGKDLYLALNLKKNLKYYGLAWFGVGALTIVGAVLYFLIFPASYDPDLGYLGAILSAVQPETAFSVEQLKQLMRIQLIQGFLLAPFANLINCFGEEWGWRGYLLPKLMKQFSVVPAVLISGLIWGIWHAPLTVMGHNYGQGYPGYPVTGILAMCVFCIVMGIIFSYLTIKTESCMPAVLGHGMLNGFSTVGMYYSSLENPFNIFLGPTPVGLIGGAGFIVLAGFLLWKLWKEEKTPCNS